jgi:uncharacterized protein involved in tolerance to divalent cations
MTVIAVVTTVGGQKEPRRMAEALVEAGRAACAQIEKIDSLCLEGRIQSSTAGIPPALQDHRSPLRGVESTIRDMHSCELPAPYAVSCEHIIAPYAA